MNIFPVAEIIKEQRMQINFSSLIDLLEQSATSRAQRLEMLIASLEASRARQMEMQIASLSSSMRQAIGKNGY